MDVGAAVAAVTLAEAVVVHAVVARLLFLAVGVPDDGQTALHRPAAKKRELRGSGTRAYGVWRQVMFKEHRGSLQLAVYRGS